MIAKELDLQEGGFSFLPGHLMNERDSSESQSYQMKTLLHMEKNIYHLTKGLFLFLK